MHRDAQLEMHRTTERIYGYIVMAQKEEMDMSDFVLFMIWKPKVLMVYHHNLS